MSDEAQLIEVHALHDELAADLWAVYNRHVLEKAGPGKINHVKFARLSMIALARMSSTLAVDTHMGQNDFVEMCRNNHQLAYDAAPKFT